MADHMLTRCACHASICCVKFDQYGANYRLALQRPLLPPFVLTTLEYHNFILRGLQKFRQPQSVLNCSARLVVNLAKLSHVSEYYERYGALATYNSGKNHIQDPASGSDIIYIHELVVPIGTPSITSSDCKFLSAMIHQQDNTAHGPALVLHWSCIGPALVLHWSCIGPALVLHWSCIGPALVLHWLPSFGTVFL